MLLALMAAAAIALGAHPVALLIVAMAVMHPEWFLVGVTVWVVAARARRPRPPGPREEAVFLEGVAAELRGGASLRQAIAGSADRSTLDLAHPARLATVGRPMPDVAEALRERLAVNGAVVAPALAISSVAGAAVAPLFDVLALRAGEAADEKREVRVVTAQARLSAWLVAGVPVAMAAGMLVFGARPGGDTAMIALVGFGLQGAGALVVWRMVRTLTR